MVKRKTDEYFVDKIRTDLQFIIDHTRGLEQEEFENDEVLVDPVMFRLIQISENSDRLTEIFKLKYSDIPWRAIKGLRNRIVHEYGNVDLSVIYYTVKDDIPTLLNVLKSI